MKNIFKYVMAAVIGIAAFSCELDKYPYDAIEQSQSFSTINDAKSLRNGLYANLRGRLYGIYTFSTDVQADMLNATLDFGNRNGFPHRWDGFLDTDAGYFELLAIDVAKYKTRIFRIICFLCYYFIIPILSKMIKLKLVLYTCLIINYLN